MTWSYQTEGAKPLLTGVMKKKMLEIFKLDSRTQKKVMFSDKITFPQIRGGQMMVRGPKGSSRCDTNFTMKTVKHPDSVVVWGSFSGKNVLL